MCFSTQSTGDVPGRRSFYQGLRAGAFYFVELLLGFHIGFVGRLNTRKKLIMDGKAVAWYYVTKGQFFVDTLTAVAWIAQVGSKLSSRLQWAAPFLLHATCTLQERSAASSYHYRRMTAP